MERSPVSLTSLNSRCPCYWKESGTYRKVLAAFIFEPKCSDVFFRELEIAMYLLLTILQRDLNTLSEWENKWLMSFNPSKCVHLTITRKTNPLKSSYSICGSVIQQSNSAKYLGSNYHKQPLMV